MIRYLIFLVFVFSLGMSCKTKEDSNPAVQDPIRISFGSCAHQDEDQPLLKVALNTDPDMFIYLGDNIYGDTDVMDTLRAKYSRLASKPEFQNLMNQTSVYATWDDHDYGLNDAGRHYAYKSASKDIFMDFWNVPADSKRRQREGIYGVEYLQRNGIRVQIILLDTRTFRDDLIPVTQVNEKNDYGINPNPDSTLLGTAQWAWLEEQFRALADVRIIASSNQFSHEYNGWESWTNVPHEQRRMLDLIRTTKANGVVFISGDVHWAEISKMPVKGSYPIYDVTSSGITSTWDVIEPNRNRVGPAIPQNNIGLITIQKTENSVFLELSVLDSTEQKVLVHNVELSEISF